MLLACSRLFFVVSPRLGIIRICQPKLGSVLPSLVTRSVPLSKIARRFATSYHEPLTMASVNTTQRLAELRRLMKERDIDIYGKDSQPHPHPALVVSHAKVRALLTVTSSSRPLRGCPFVRVHSPM